MKRVAKLVEFGRGGDSVNFGGGCTCSGYGNPDSPHAAKGDIPDGTFAIDKRDAVETPEGLKWVFNGPMCNPDIPDGECDACPQPSAIMAEALTSDSSNQFGQLLTMQENQRGVGHKRSGLDTISISEYVEGWRDHGRANRAVCGR